MSKQAFICDAIRTPFRRTGGVLSSIRTDDLAALPIAALRARNAKVDWENLTDVLYGCVNPFGEGSRNVARMAALLAGLRVTVSGTTINRQCGSGLEALGLASRVIKSGEAALVIAGGVESINWASPVLPNAEGSFSRVDAVHAATSDWCFINQYMTQQYGIESMSAVAENVALDFGIERDSQDRMALASRRKALAAQKAGWFDAEITPVVVQQKTGTSVTVGIDELSHDALFHVLQKLQGTVSIKGSVTVGNSSGASDGAAALLIADESSAIKNGLTPLARIVGMATADVSPRIVGIGPVPATQKLLAITGVSLDQIDVIELGEAFAAPCLAVLRQWGLRDDDPRVNPNGGAIAMGHPFGASGARMAMTAVYQLHRIKGRYALCTMSSGVDQGIAVLLEAV